MISGCPGSAGITGTPTLKLKSCPECGAELELFSSEMTTSCPKCGFVAYNDTQTCLLWCKYAKECVGEEVYHQYMQHMKREESAREDGGSADMA